MRWARDAVQLPRKQMRGLLYRSARPAHGSGHWSRTSYMREPKLNGPSQKVRPMGIEPTSLFAAGDENTESPLTGSR